MPLRDFPLVPFSKMSLPKRNHPKHLASTHAAVVCAASQRCALSSTPGLWYFWCLGSWVWTELNTRTTMLLETWWGSQIYAVNTEQCWASFCFCLIVLPRCFFVLQRAALYWIQTLISSRKWGIFAKYVKLLVQTHNSWSREEHSVCPQVKPIHSDLA